MYNTVNNPIPHCNLFATPTLESITSQIEALPVKDRAVAHMVMQLTMNACHQLVKESIPEVFE
jgi:hypothetical protein